MPDHSFLLQALGPWVVGEHAKATEAQTPVNIAGVLWEVFVPISYFFHY